MPLGTRAPRTLLSGVPAGMFCIIILLWTLDAVAPDVCKAIQAAFNPALNWIARWLPLFYVPALVLVPTSLSAFTGTPRPGRNEMHSSGEPAGRRRHKGLHHATSVPGLSGLNMCRLL